jgi:S-DNA-T family DNA segregation ATPase FtsK/SpoIIIE
MTAERPGAVPSSVLASCADRWLFHLGDASEATACGVPPALVPAGIAGRVVVASTRLEAQLAVVDPAPVTKTGGGPAAVGVLPRQVRAAELRPGAVNADGELDLVVGVDFETLGPAHLLVPDGEHVLVAGPPRTGRSTALVRLATSWQEAHPDGEVVVISPVRRSPLASRAGAVAGIGLLPGGSPALVVVDDAERVDDTDGALARLVAERRPGVLVVAAARPDTLRTLYGHWSAVVRRSRTGLLMTGCSDIDGDLFSELLPRTPPIPARPGLAWVIGAGGRSLAQIAHDQVDQMI